MYNNCSLTKPDDLISTADIFLLSVTVTPHPWIIHIGAAITYIVIASNIVIISAFLRKDFISPSTILLAGLASSDALTAICLFLPKHFGLLFYQMEYARTNNSTVTILCKYPFCGYIFWMDSVLISVFHLISLILTLFLALQKVLAISFPLRSKVFIKKRTSRISVFVTFIVLLTIYIIYGCMFKFRDKENICIVSFESWVSEYFFQYILLLASVIYISVTVLLIISSLYICAKLTCSSQNLQRTETARLRNIHRRSAAIVVSIVAIFILSEFLSMLCIFQVTFTNSDTLCRNKYYDYSDLTLVVGFAANYFVYLTMSRQLRTLLTKHLTWWLPFIKSSDVVERPSIRSISHAMGDRELRSN